MSLRLPLALAFALLAAPVTAAAQRPFTLAFQGGPAFPTGQLGGADLKTGFGFEATISYRFLPRLAGYGGWAWHRFTFSEPASAFAAPGTDVEETGYVLGLRFEQPVGSGNSPLLVLRAGGTWNHIEIEDASGNQVTDSGHGIGWEAGAGMAFALGTRWQIVPSARYRSLARDLTVGSTTTPAKLTYVAVEVGGHWSF